MLEKRKTCFRIRTGSEQLNKILGGGFESRSVSEVYGEFRCGMARLSSHVVVDSADESHRKNSIVFDNVRHCSDAPL